MGSVLIYFYISGMKKLILLLLIGLSFNLNAQIGAYTSREIDSIVIQEGGALSVMVNKSQKRQKKWQKVNRKIFDKEISKYKLLQSQLAIGEENGKKIYVFSHQLCWMRAFGCEYLNTTNKFIRDDNKVKFGISRDEAIKKLKEAKDLLDIEMMTRKEFDKIKEELGPIIKGSS